MTKSQCGLSAASAVTLLLIYAYAPVSLARTDLTTAIGVSYSFVDNINNDSEESGTITQLTPTLNLNYDRSKLDLSLNYSLKLIDSAGLDTVDRATQDLKLNSQISHIPQRWVTMLTARASQASISSDGIQIADEFTKSANSSELRRLGFNNLYQGKLSDTLYKINLFANTAGFKGFDQSKSYGYSLAVQNDKPQKLGWQASIKTTRYSSATKSNDIDFTKLQLNYRINYKLRTYIQANKAITSNSNLNDLSTTLGLTWRPSKLSQFMFGFGKRGDTATYSLDSSLRSRRLSFSLGYTERVTSALSISINELNQQQATTQTVQDLSIEPVLLQEAKITLGYTGRKNNLSLSVKNMVKNIVDAVSADDKNIIASVLFDRKLSFKSRLQLALTQRKSQVAQENTVDDIALRYFYNKTKMMNYSFEARRISQNSDVDANIYRSSRVVVTLNFAF